MLDRSLLTEDEYGKIMLHASIMGAAIGQNGSALPHGMGYNLSQYKGVNHGFAGCIFLAEYLRIFRDKSRVNEILHTSGFESIDELDEFIRVISADNVSFAITNREILQWADEFECRAIKKGTHMKKTLIAFFSHAGENYAANGLVHIAVGNTEVVANKLHGITDYDLFKIEAVKPYPAGYRDCVNVSKAELRDNARPELKNCPESLEEYDTIILAYPCWCGTMPMPVWTFLERFELEGKTIYPLCTHEGSGMGRSESDLRKLCPTADIKKGLSVFGSRAALAEPLLRSWLSL